MWKWFEGKKTKIGAALILLAQAGKTFTPEYAQAWALLEQTGMWIAGLGLVHAGAKKIIPIP